MNNKPPVKLFNTLSKQLETVQPLTADEVTLYTCGPTVYDHAHIGNLRTYIYEDILRRTLRAFGYRVQHVMNVTDVDDKTIARSQEEYPDRDAHTALQQLTRHYEQVFLDDAQRLGIDLSDTTVTRATEHIDAMQDMIRAIPNKYRADDGIYFAIAEYEDYGVLEDVTLSNSQSRIHHDEYDKHDSADFALWKRAEAGEPDWDFHIDGENVPGRPGWHIECSAMATQYLGQPFDIHTGGIDLKFPHHENEIAQAKAAHNCDLATMFLHAEHLLVEGRKMSKRWNNFHTLRDIEHDEVDPLAFRLLVLQAHYRSQQNFTWDALRAAAAHLESLRAFADLAFQPLPGAPALASAQAQSAISAALADDLNTPQAVAELSRLVDSIEAVSPDDIHDFQTYLQWLDEVLGLQLSQRQDIDDESKQLLRQRQECREQGDYETADQLRQQLHRQGIGIKDTAYGPVWYRLRRVEEFA